MNIEDRCRLICTINNINPDADAHAIFQKTPGFKRAEDGRVKNWMVWITTVDARINRARTVAKKERKIGKNNL